MSVDSKDEPSSVAVVVALPASIVDAHHHFVDTSQPHATFLASLCGPDTKYLPPQYLDGVRDDLKNAGIDLAGSVHMEAMPDEGSKEAAWIEEFGESSSIVKAVVGSVDLARGGEKASEDMIQLKETSPRVKGVRWILDCVGKFDGTTKTHPATKRHDGIDYLRGSDGGYEGTTVPSFEEGYARLAEHGLTFDLQCAPEQLLAAAELAKKYPDVKVVIDHLGKPRRVLGEADEDNTNIAPDEEEMKVWRAGMKAMADVPHAYVKLSMMGCAVPGWTEHPAREDVLQSIVLEIVETFGPQRCMFATNWWANAALSDNDGTYEKGPGAAELVRKVAGWLAAGGYGEEDRDRIFKGTAEEFYGIA